eukprot:10023808-Lingulodinium_polyedra.AAC.1
MLTSLATLAESQSPMSAVPFILSCSHITHLRGRDVDKAAKYCEATKDWLHTSARLFVASHSSEPMLIHYGADGTPISTRERFTHSVGDVSVRRDGRECKEWIVSRCFISCMGQQRLVFTEPRR